MNRDPAKERARRQRATAARKLRRAVDPVYRAQENARFNTSRRRRLETNAELREIERERDRQRKARIREDPERYALILERQRERYRNDPVARENAIQNSARTKAWQRLFNLETRKKK